jgi:aryl-alcohol dehydrogenase-like predicted oxidoreductase
LAALDEAVRAGKVRVVGCSNFSAAQLREAEEAAGAGAHFLSVQNHYNLLNRQDEEEVLPLCEKLGLAYLPYFPLASGLLTGKYNRGQAPPEGTRLQRWGDRAGGVLTEDNFDKVEALTSWAQAHGHTVLDLAFAWLLARPAVVSVIAGATKVEQVRANAATATWRLSPEQVAEVDALLPAPDAATRPAVAGEGRGS